MLWARVGLGYIQRSLPIFFFNNYNDYNFCEFQVHRKLHTWTGIFCFMCFCWTWLAPAMQNMVFLMVCRRKAVTLPWAATFLSWPNSKSHPHILKSTGKRTSSWIWPWAPGSNFKVVSDFKVGPPVWGVLDQKTSRISFWTNYSIIPQ